MRTSKHNPRIVPLVALPMAVVLTLAAVGVSFGQFETPQLSSSAGGSTGEIRADGCTVDYINKVDVPALAEGKLVELRFEEGDSVSTGDVMGIIEDTQAKLTVEFKKAEQKEAEFNATNTVNFRNATNALNLASAEAESFRALRREGAIAKWELKKKEFEVDRTELQIELAEMEQLIARIKYYAKRSEVELAEFELTRRKITAPSTGYVEKRIAQLGQWVQPGTPLATVIQMDKLRVEGWVDALRYPGKIVKGMPAQVLIYAYAQADKAIEVSGTLGYVSMEIDGADRHRVWVEVENKRTDRDWLIKPGMRAEIVVRPTEELR